jgi:hypothetical protein
VTIGACFLLVPLSHAVQLTVGSRTQIWNRPLRISLDGLRTDHREPFSADTGPDSDHSAERFRRSDATAAADPDSTTRLGPDGAAPTTSLRYDEGGSDGAELRRGRRSVPQALHRSTSWTGKRVEFESRRARSRPTREPDRHSPRWLHRLRLRHHRRAAHRRQRDLRPGGQHVPPGMAPASPAGTPAIRRTTPPSTCRSIRAPPICANVVAPPIQPWGCGPKVRNDNSSVVDVHARQ